MKIYVFAEKIKISYESKLQDEDFFKLIEMATPYAYLSELKFGSRPTKRSTQKKIDFNSIRAIPWILCWTQTRVLFPTWWGVGQAWREIKNNEDESIQKGNDRFVGSGHGNIERHCSKNTEKNCKKW